MILFVLTGLALASPPDEAAVTDPVPAPEVAEAATAPETAPAEPSAADVVPEPPAPVASPVAPRPWSALQLQQRVHEELLRDGVSLSEQQLIFELSGDADEGWIVALLGADDSSRVRWLPALPAELDAAAAELRLVVQGLLEEPASSAGARPVDPEARRLARKVEIARDVLGERPLAMQDPATERFTFGVMGLASVGIAVASGESLDRTWPVLAGGGAMLAGVAAGMLLPEDSRWSRAATFGGTLMGMGAMSWLGAMEVESAAFPDRPHRFRLDSGAGVLGTSMIASGAAAMVYSAVNPACVGAESSRRFASVLAAPDSDRARRVAELEQCLLRERERLDKVWIPLAPMAIGAAVNVGLGLAADDEDARLGHLAMAGIVLLGAGIAVPLVALMPKPAETYLAQLEAQGLRLELGAPGAVAGLSLRGEL